jgi:hypothetical protein
VRLAALLRSLALGLLLGTAGWRGVEYLLREGRPRRLLERAISAAPAEPRTGLTGVILFRPNECPELMRTMDQLNAIDSDEIRIVGGLTVEEHRMPDWHVLVEAQQIRFPVYRLDPRKALASTASLGYTGGPLLLVFDRDGRVLLATDVLRQQNLKEFLDQLAQRFSPQRDHRRQRA